MITRASTRRQFLRDVQQSSEPVGIVIADGAPAVPVTRFLAYVWGAAPTDAELERAGTEPDRALAAAS